MLHYPLIKIVRHGFNCSHYPLIKIVRHGVADMLRVLRTLSKQGDLAAPALGNGARLLI